MTAPAIIAGSLVDVRNVNQHKCVRLIIDVPAEHALKVIEAFAWPTMVNPVAVAVARLEQSKGGDAHTSEHLARQHKTPPVPLVDKAGRAPKAWDSLPLSQQAGIRCGERAFWRFLEPYYGSSIYDADHAAECVRVLCGGIGSRAELKINSAPGRLWQKLDSRYRAWQREAEVVPA